MAVRNEHELIDVYLTEPGEGPPPWGPLEHLPPDSPMPQVGDVILLPRRGTGDTKEQTYAWEGNLAPFRVVDRHHVYYRAGHEKLDPVKPQPARYVRTLIYVRRMTKAEYDAGPGHTS